MAQYSTIIEVNSNTEKSLSYLLSVSTTESTKSVLTTIQRLSTISEHVTLNDVVTNSSYSRTMVREQFTKFKRTGVVTTKSARTVFPDAPKRLEIFTFLPVSELPGKFDLQKPKSPRGRKATAIANAILNEAEIYTPTDYRRELTESQVFYQMVIEENVSNLIAPANQIVTRKEEILITNEGRRIVNFAQSEFGIINDFDSIVINFLSKATIAYIATLPDHRQLNLNENRRIPIWVDDLLKIYAKSDNAFTREKICMSIIRIRYTIFKFLQAPKSEREHQLSKELGYDISNDFQFLESLQILSKRSQVAYDEDMFLDDGRPENNVLRSFGNEIPFSVFYISWSSEFYRKNFGRGKLFLLNDSLNRIPPTLYRLYKELRIDYFRGQNSVLFKDDYKCEMVLLDLVKFIWKNEKNDSDYHNLVSTLLVDIKKMARNHSDIVTISELDSKSVVLIELFGFVLEFKIENLERHYVKANGQSIVRMLVDEQKVITDSGATYNSKISNNTPTGLNPISHIVKANLAEDLNNKARRYLPDAATRIKDCLQNFRTGKYCIQFSYDKDDYLLSHYTSQDELDDIVLRLAKKLNLPIDFVDIFFDTTMKGIAPLPYLDWEKMIQLENELNIKSQVIIRFFIVRIRAIQKYLSLSTNDLRDAIEISME